ncbi:MAG: hypothetical protein KDC18_11125, partial [Alphaproteobacteria bacterium]|nr:hypothetical protein [Alphaproteobacteria bacterium]
MRTRTLNLDTSRSRASGFARLTLASLALLSILPTCHAQLLAKTTTLGKVEQDIEAVIDPYRFHLGDPFACEFEDDRVRDPRDPVRDRPVLGMMDVTGVNGSRISVPCSIWEDQQNHPLTAQPTFPAIDALDRFVHVLSVPQGTNLSRIEAPSGWTLDWRQSGTRLLIWGHAPATAGDAVFQAKVSSTQTHALHQPVNVGLNRCDGPGLAWFLRVGDALDVPICAAGDTSGLSWHYLPDDPSHRLPIGFTMNLPQAYRFGGGPALCVQAQGSPYSGCTGRIQGTVSSGARTASGRLQLRNASGQVVASTVLRLDIAPHVLPAAGWQRIDTNTWVAQAPFDATKHELTSIPLPGLAGGDGQLNVDWVTGHTFPYGAGRPL